MSRLECYGKSSELPRKQVETHTRKEAVVTNPTNATPRWSLPAQSVSRSVKDSSAGRSEVLCADDVNNSVGLASPPVVLGHDFKMKDTRKSQPSTSTGTGGRLDVQPLARSAPGLVDVPPLPEPLPSPEPGGEEEQTNNHEENDTEEEDEGRQRAPLELMAEFLKSVMDKDFVLAMKLCQMILIFEPKNAEAREFIPLIQEKLQSDQEGIISQVEDVNDGEGNGSDISEKYDSEDSESDDGSDQSSESTTSDSSTSSDEEEENKLRKSLKPCSPCHITP
ncbi:hypothetical protein UPYG_G00294750 [Umbra pygmaea]|uniref:Glutamate-rich protein 2 n=1 Tax=Umbra pygmaea TaxID=75934 RepID=A0ABD0W701_UMBPY